MKPRNVIIDFSEIFAQYGPDSLTAPFVYKTCPSLKTLIRRHTLRFILEAAYRYGRETLLHRDALWELLDYYEGEDADWLLISHEPPITFGDNGDEYTVLELFFNVVTEEADIFLIQKLKEFGIVENGGYVFKRWVTPTAMLMEETTYM